MTRAITAPICQNLRESLRLEWLETNGLGGYASSTVPNCHTRKYHGWLVVTAPGLHGRHVLLSTLEDSVISQGREIFLACHRYPGVFHPQGHQYLREFRQADGPEFLFQIGDVRLRRSLLLVAGSNTVLVRYALEASPWPLILRLRPFLAFRSAHACRREDMALQVRTYPVPNGFKIQPYNALPPLFIQTTRRSTFDAAPLWYRNFEYLVEAERGYDHHEDLFQPGVMEIPLRPGADVIVVAGIAETQPLSKRIWDREVARRRAEQSRIADQVRQQPDPALRTWLGHLIPAGRHFLAHSAGGRPTVIAGYPWFEDWGRDLLIALPGLTFCAGRTDEGLALLTAVGSQEKDGLIPNCFADDPAHRLYNSVDAALWYCWAVQQMFRHTGDGQAVQSLFWPVLQRILQHYMAGTLHGIFMTPDGLLHAGNRTTQLTWMDATVHGTPVTPRHGYAVEINALWFNALRFAEELTQTLGLRRFWEPDLLARMQAAFTRMFWLPQAEHLADVFADGILDTAMRPNQIFAVSLPYSPLSPAQQKSVVDAVRRELLTPFGLRTLSPRHPAYRGRYAGDQPTRDAAYHQGTVWPWLLGPFGEAYLRVEGHSQPAARFLLETIEPLLHHCFGSNGMGLVPEVFDGDPPHMPNGCPHQAWSVAELTRLMTLMGGSPVAAR